MERRSLTRDRASEGRASEIEVYVEVHNRQGLMLSEARRYDEAIASYNCTLRLKEDNFPAWYGRGAALANLGQYRAALLSFNRAIEVDPSQHEAWTFRAVVLIHLTRYQEALTDCEHALALQPHDWEALTFRGVAFYYLGQYKRAYESYDRATGRTKQKRKLLTSVTKLLNQFKHKQAE